MKVAQWSEIADVLPTVDVQSAIEEAFAAYSRGEAVVPPVGEMSFDDPPGEVHLKYGYLKNGEHYVVKIASGFYDNPSLGLPSSQGLMLLFDQATGVLSSVLLDEGKLTDLRTGAAGAVAARHLAPERIEAIGVGGTGHRSAHVIFQRVSTLRCVRRSRLRRQSRGCRRDRIS